MGVTMPVSIDDVNRFLELAKVARECRVKRLGDVVKLKLRLRRRLYVIKLPKDKAEEVLRQIKCKIVEV